jgi:hypothetical protein
MIGRGESKSFHKNHGLRIFVTNHYIKRQMIITKNLYLNIDFGRDIYWRFFGCFRSFFKHLINFYSNF